MSDFDRCFDAVFCRCRQMVVLYKRHLGDNIYHVCTIDSHDFYRSSYWRLDPADFTFTFVREG